MNLERKAGVPAGSRRRLSPEPLSRMESLIELLGSPQLQYPAIHITGTNGKTSAARIATSLLVNAGLSVGTDTSPYLERFNERISWNGEPIPDDDLDRILGAIADVELLLDDRPTYFEIVNAAALVWFADVAVEVAVIEVDLGGGVPRPRARRRHRDEHVRGGRLAGTTRGGAARAARDRRRHQERRWCTRGARRARRGIPARGAHVGRRRAHPEGRARDAR